MVFSLVNTVFLQNFHKINMSISPSTLDSILLSNVVELSFIKKDGSTRNMTCTKSYELLSSFEGRSFLKYQEPKGNPRNLPSNLLTVWDIDSQGFRTVNCESVDILSIISIENFRKMLIEKFV